MSRGPFYFEIFAISLAAIILEISYTRIFSFKLYHYFTFLVIAIALLGLGAGGVFVTISSRLRRAQPERLIVLSALAGSIAIFAGYFVVAGTQLNAFALGVESRELIKLLLISVFLFAPFLAAGIIITTIFNADQQAINRLYCSDLLGAGIGCATCVPLIYVLTPPGCVMLSGLVYAVAAARLASRRFPALFQVAAATVVIGAAAVAFQRQLPEPAVDQIKTLGNYNPETSPVVFSRWSTVFRVDVMHYELMPGGWNYMINHDGNLGSVLVSYDGNPDSLGYFDGDPRSVPFRVMRPDPRVLIIGAAGGHEILASLHFKAAHITGIELNPVTVSLLTVHFADYSGHIAEDPRVTLINAEGRSYMRQTDDKYDLIWLVAPDTYAAMNAATSGGFVLSESYLYTVEMIQEGFKHLTENGVICAQFGEFDFDNKPNRTTRYLTTAREAFRRAGETRFADHVLVATTPDIVHLSTILLKKAAFTAEEKQHFGAAIGSLTDGVVRFGGDGKADESPIGRAITASDAELRAWYDVYPFEVDPVTDDSPFFWHFSRFKDAARSEVVRERRGVHLGLEDVVGERVLLILLGFATVFAAVWLLMPFVFIRRTWQRMPFKLNAAIYFAALGTGFMFFEVSLIQMLTLFLGYPSYSLSVTLFGLLIFSGLGSLLMGGGVRQRRATLYRLLACVTVLMIFYQFGMPSVMGWFIGAPLPIRFGVAIVMIAPLALCLGAFMPIGLTTVAALSPDREEFVAWSWAVNGFFSVISAILSTILAMVFGFKLLLLAAVVIYAFGIMSLLRIPEAGGAAAR